MTTGNERKVVQPRIAIPFAGDLAVARSILQVHKRNVWTGRCGACRERHPCLDRRQALLVVTLRG